MTSLSESMKNKVDHGADSFKTYAITVRPKDGITDVHLSKFCKWVKKHCLYYHVVTEKTDFERHIHAGVVFHVARKRCNVLTLMKFLFRDFTDEEKKVLLRGVKIMYNEDFIKNYLDKNDDTVVIESCLPEAGHMEKYFPPKKIESDGRTKKCSVYYHELERLWYEHNEPHVEVNTINVRDFLFRMMYSLRVLPVIRDDQTIKQTAKHLTRWINKSETCPSDFLAPFEKEE